jgi:hypothetical protein
MNYNQASMPAPVVAAVFHVEPHPDPTVRQLIAEIERLRLENERLTAELYDLGKGP